MSFYDQGALNRAANAYNGATNTWQAVNPDATAQTATDSFQNLDQTGADAQKQALGQLQQEYSSGGMDPQAQAATQQAQAQSAAQQNGAIERAAASGTMDSGRAVGAALTAQQQAGMQTEQAGADAATRANTALTNAASVGSNLTGQAQATAQGQNQASQFNTGQVNTNAQQNVQNEMGKAAGVAGAQTNLGAFNMGNAQAANSLAQAGISAVGNIAASAAKVSDERVKKDIKDTGREIDGVPEKTFKYKNDPTDTTFKGVIAQDVQKERPEDIVKGQDGLLRVTNPSDQPKPTSLGDSFMSWLHGSPSQADLDRTQADSDRTKWRDEALTRNEGDPSEMAQMLRATQQTGAPAVAMNSPGHPQLTDTLTRGDGVDVLQHAPIMQSRTPYDPDELVVDQMDPILMSRNGRAVPQPQAQPTAVAEAQPVQKEEDPWWGALLGSVGAR